LERARACAALVPYVFSVPQTSKSAVPQVSNLPKTPHCQGDTKSDAPISTPNCPACADLQKVISTWPELSEPLRRAILAIANSATEKEGQ